MSPQKRLFLNKDQNVVNRNVSEINLPPFSIHPQELVSENLVEEQNKQINEEIQNEIRTGKLRNH